VQPHGVVMEGVVRDYLDMVVAAARDVVAGKLAATWAVGSLATGELDLRCSDLDVIAVSARPLDAGERTSLAHRLSHSRLECPAHGLDFILYAESELRSLRRTPCYEFSISTGPDWQDDVGAGGLYAGGILDLELARTRGVTLAGVTPGQVIAPVPMSWIREEAVNSVRWHKTRIHDSFHDPFGTNAVLNACRASRLLRTGELVSKSEGARWRLSQQPEEVVVAALQARGQCGRERLDYAMVLGFVDKVLAEVAKDTI